MDMVCGGWMGQNKEEMRKTSFMNIEHSSEEKNKRQ
jgi:hypothetical protein